MKEPAGLSQSRLTETLFIPVSTSKVLKYFIVCTFLKEQGIEGFSNIIDTLHYTAVPPSWPFSGFDSIVYNSDFPIPYKNFLNLNAHSHRLYFPYHTCYDDVVCVQEELIKRR
jgi:hypothetical protein